MKYGYHEFIQWRTARIGQEYYQTGKGFVAKLHRVTEKNKKGGRNVKQNQNSKSTRLGSTRRGA